MNWKAFLFQWKNFWIALGLLAAGLRSFLSTGVVENYYSRGIFIYLRHSIDFFTGWMPFALVYVFAAGLVFFLGYQIIKWVKNKNRWQAKLLAFFHSTLAVAGGIVFFFLALWGYNYDRVPLEKIAGITPDTLSIQDLRMELDAATADVVRQRALLPGISDSTIAANWLPGNLENEVRQELKKCLAMFGYPSPGNVRGRILAPKGLLLRLSTAGIYIPFTGEGHVDGGLHHLQLPFVLAHEMSHGYGFGDEGTCNFLAYLALTQSENAYLRYAGFLYYWRYVASDYRFYEPEAYEIFRETLPQGVKNDLLAIRNEMEKYPDILPAVRDALYGSYLRAQGIEEGLKNYDRVILLMHAWRRKAVRGM